MSRLQERIENFNRAYNLFAMARNEYINNRTNDMNKLALIQGFEIVTELTPISFARSASGLLM